MAAAAAPWPRSPSPPPADTISRCVADLRRLERFLRTLGRGYTSLRAAPNALRRVHELYAWIEERVEAEAALIRGMRIVHYTTHYGDYVESRRPPSVQPEWRVDDGYGCPGLAIDVDIGGVFEMWCCIELGTRHLKTWFFFHTADFELQNDTEYKLDRFRWSRVEYELSDTTVRANRADPGLYARLRLIEDVFDGVGAWLDARSLFRAYRAPGGEE
jgi:hypothetical protein